MTWKELLGLSADEWDTIDDEKLHKILSPYFHVTRPEQGRLSEDNIKSSKKKPSTSGQDRKGNQLSFASMQKELLRQATMAGIILPTNKPK